MTKTFIPRTVSFEDDKKIVSLDAAAALADPRLVGHPLILLGEAGSGKSELLRYWGGKTVATARQIMNGWTPSQGRVFVDGLDEAAGVHDGDALDRLLGLLKAQNDANFVIACRVADWRSASGGATIQQWTGSNPVEITIAPLDSSDAASFLEHNAELSRSDAENFVAHYVDRGLGEWLGNPQTLKMLAEVAEVGSRPHTTGDLFKQYVDRNYRDHRKQNHPLATLGKAEVLSGLGALFAALVVGGYEALTLAPGNPPPGDLPLEECQKLPALSALTRDELRALLNSRLVSRAGPDRFTYVHRRIGEYLGASWLAEQVKTPEIRKRLLGSLRHGNQVPSNLRGLWGWLANSDDLTTEVIRADPLAVIEYGNADTLSRDGANSLLGALERADEEHEAFGWRDYRAAALVQPAMMTEVERVLSIPGEKRFWTQFILLRQMREPEVVARHIKTLRALILDEGRPYAIRDAAADALADHGHVTDWPQIIDLLVSGTIRESLRLALVLMINPRIGITLSDAEFAQTVYDYSGLTPRFPGNREVGTVGLYYYGAEKPVPDNRLDGLLDALTDCARRYLSEERTFDGWDVEHLFYSLLQRRLELGPVNPDALWNWLNDVDYDRYGGTRERRAWLDEWLVTHDATRRLFQRRVFDSLTDNPRSLSWRLHEIAPGLRLTPDDLIPLIAQLPAGDWRWRELLWLAPTGDEGESVRLAASRHVKTADDTTLLENHACPPPPPQDEEDRHWKAQHERERRERRDGLRREYLAVQQKMRAGFWGALAGPANVYMGRVHEAKRDLPAELRIGAWIGDDLQADALVGFESFLVTPTPSPPSATEIANSSAENRHWNAALIISAALAERRRVGVGFTDLPTERLQAGLFAERAAFLDDNEWEDLREAIIAELEARGAWLETARMFIDPQLRKRRDWVSWLWRVLASPPGELLAAEWLEKFPRMAAEPEEAMIDKLLAEGSEQSRNALISIAKRRRRQKLSDRRRTNWSVVELILGSLPPKQIGKLAAEDRNVLWTLRDRLARRRHRDSSVAASPSVLAATIAAFASAWPVVPRPTGVTSGDTNAWDASDFISGCLDTLASDPSEDATSALASIANIDFGYEWKIKRSIVDQRLVRANAEWQPRKVHDLIALLSDGPPVDHADLQRVVLEEIEIVQRKISSNDAGSVELFYDGGRPKLEPACDAVLTTLLRQDDHRLHSARRLSFILQPRLSGTRAGDIWCESEGLAIAIECKRHWHRDLWTAFDWQLSGQQASDWRSRSHGIYLVYWFGDEVHSVTRPNGAKGSERPKSALELEIALNECISERGLSNIAVKVLDVSRSAS